MFLVLRNNTKSCKGMTLLELLISIAIASLLIAGMSNTVSQALKVKNEILSEEQLQNDLDFAFSRIVRITQSSSLLILPLSDNPASDWPENIRVQTFPASAPVGSSAVASAVLSITLPANWDLDGDGFADADNDKDGLIDEDLPDDANEDAKTGLWLIDDDGDGTVDEADVGSYGDDDEGKPEVTQKGEDPLNGIDDDADGSVDEDPPADMNDDGCPGICGVDDDGDGSVDEGDPKDDDEDGLLGEDWYDTIVYYLDVDQLMERIPVPWDESGGSGISGRDVIISTLTGNVSRFYIERIADSENGVLVRIELELTAPDGSFTVQTGTTVRLGGSL